MLDPAVMSRADVLQRRLRGRLAALERELAAAQADHDARRERAVCARIAQAACRLDAARLILRAGWPAP